MTLNKIFSAFGVLLMLLLANSCADEDLKPIITFDDAGKGAYPRRITETDKLINLFDVAGSNYEYTIEFVDLEQGNLVAEYVLDLVYEDNNPDNGDNSTGPIQFRSWSAGDFETNADGFKGLSNIRITGPEAIAAAGLSEDQVLAGDEFQFQGRVITTDGAVFTASNSSAAVNGSAFRGHFNFTLPAGCPSSLDGTYNYSTTDVWCAAAAGQTYTGTVDLIGLGGGEYYFSDWSFGAYTPCYGITLGSSDGVKVKEICAVVSFSGFVSEFGDTFTFEHELNGADWKITWSNDFGEAGVSVITNPSGDWPFTIK